MKIEIPLAELARVIGPLAPPPVDCSLDDEPDEPFDPPPKLLDLARRTLGTLYRAILSTNEDHILEALRRSGGWPLGRLDELRRGRLGFVLERLDALHQHVSAAARWPLLPTWIAAEITTAAEDRRWGARPSPAEALDQAADVLDVFELVLRGICERDGLAVAPEIKGGRESLEAFTRKIRQLADEVRP